MIKIITTFILFFVFLNIAEADVYKHKDKNGKIYYTDNPPADSKGYKRIIKTKVIVRLRKQNNQLGRLSSFSKGGFSKKGFLEAESLNRYVSLGGRGNVRYSSRSAGRYRKMSNSAKANKRKYSAYVAQSARKYNVDERLVHAVILAESAYNPNARSPVGAVGLMQLMPATARRFGVTNRRDPKQSIDGGTHYLKILLRMFNSTKLAVAGYNAGEGAVLKYNRTVPPYRETRNYVKKVLAYYRG